ncbi:30S ribosomal protein S15 [Candidatus Hodgkinia cicadicola]|nr:30S ribosomal protein S15 [Candidatus Hodgkinia cicadicola]
MLATYNSAALAAAKRIKTLEKHVTLNSKDVSACRKLVELRRSLSKILLKFSSRS